MSSSTLSIRLNTRTKAKLDALAKASRRSKSFLAAEAIEAFVTAESSQQADLQAGIEDLDAGHTIDHGEVRQWLQSWGKKRELFGLLSSEIARQLKKHGVTEDKVLADFEAWRKSERATGRRR
jgi:RHH-type transcriptional regulator, rel operon repressor / antitoxin RelB